ncbi:hypothetical protein [Marinibactrum halimedae]|uniref:Uncharacterized protein n=1 Tax=Marinibactrum halimedae TaxID=1444977 RepID=A0AA37WKP1_9GAMM|nr:hypothetical protein [Marinibactrum halimedae]MCD9457812.1 hypothetical protein [Marinibactrum halimedae]GLS24814.1 hypothetical protein GCM10007877_05280 [Marinibactrum halimedae]
MKINNGEPFTEAKALIKVEDVDYPRLCRLCCDFNFRVATLNSHQESNENTNRHTEKYTNHFKLVSLSDNASTSASPECGSMNALEEYVQNHMTDILHDYLFGDTTDLETESSQELKFY